MPYGYGLAPKKPKQPLANLLRTMPKWQVEAMCDHREDWMGELACRELRRRKAKRILVKGGR